MGKKDRERHELWLMKRGKITDKRETLKNFIF